MIGSSGLAEELEAAGMKTVGVGVSNGLMMKFTLVIGNTFWKVADFYIQELKLRKYNFETNAFSIGELVVCCSRILQRTTLRQLKILFLILKYVRDS